MRILPDLPDLHILPADALRPHEHHEDRRTAPLAEALRREGILRNPPIVLRLSGHEERYLVLDGANRTTAFQQLGFKYVLAQVVHPGDNQVAVETWNHAVLNLTEEELLGAVGAAGEAELLESTPEQATADMIQGTSLAYLSLRSNRVMSVAAIVPDLRSRVAGLNRTVQAYQSRGRIERTNAGSAAELERAFPAAAGLVVFLAFTVQDVVEAASEGLLLPAGLTRFIVSPRALRVNYPLEALALDETREAKEQALTRWVHDRVVGRKVRYYAEATYLFDE
jgi:hypothetical protein